MDHLLRFGRDSTILPETGRGDFVNAALDGFIVVGLEWTRLVGGGAQVLTLFGTVSRHSHHSEVVFFVIFDLDSARVRFIIIDYQLIMHGSSASTDRRLGGHVTS